MNSKFFAAILVVSVWILAVSLSAEGRNADDISEKIVEGKRYLTEKLEEKDIKILHEKGCEIDKKSKRIASVICPEDAAAELGLRENIKVYASDLNADRQIGADSVWNAGYNGTGRLVAILDTGIDYNHVELLDSYAGGWNFVANNSNPYDDNGHGTHVSGIITANGVVESAKGAAPDAKILALKVLDSSGSGYFSDVIEAIYHSVDGHDGDYGTADDFNPDAISMSLGSSYPYLYTGSNCDSAYPEMANAVNYAVSRGIMVVAAAGNDARGVSIPGCMSNATAVAAVDGSDVRAPWSGTGGSLDIAAPGVGVYSTVPSGYGTKSGTSIATPFISATVALLKQANSSMKVSDIRNALYNTAKDFGSLGWDKYYGWGRVNASAALIYALSPPAKPKMHIARIDMAKQTSFPKTRAAATVYVVNEAGNPVSGASVSGKWSGLTFDSDTGTTDSGGKTVIYSDWKTKAKGTFTFSVTNMAKAGWIYDYSANLETGDSITV